MALVDVKAIAAASASFPKPPAFVPTYGTAGFRANASLLESTLFRCGLLAAARSLLTRRACGLMITASHNPAEDNGVKLVEPDGGMLPQAWEPFATDLAQASSHEEVANLLAKVLEDNIKETSSAAEEDPHASAAAPTEALAGAPKWGPRVLIGVDTRDSAPALLAAAQAGVTAMGLAADLAGRVTTPQLHFMVHAHNSHPDHPPARASLPLYFKTLLSAFEQLVDEQKPAFGGPSLHVDCANGIGAEHLKTTVKQLEATGLLLRLHNTGDGRLNHLCGADFVQKERVAPACFDDLVPGARCCSIDGDADRLVFFTPPDLPLPLAGENPAPAPAPLDLIDGDKIATLAATAVRDLLDRLPAEVSSGIKVGVIQTAYANGASTSYISQTLRLPVECTPTGVKHLHEAAHKYDVGIYWEANGHGTVLFSHHLLQRLEAAAAGSAAARDLLLLSRVINQTVGDAISGILMVEAMLRRKMMSFEDWSRMYKDLPSRQSKLQVSDRSAITTRDAERVCATPPGLQEAIDKAVAGFPAGSRSFVRPSGTEDAVRVYAEAPTQAEADELARQVCRAVYDLAGGVGERP